MPRFIQLHVLTSYPACNLNRDDLGRPKTVRLPGGERLRVSSQSLKRAWRCSEVFQRALAGNLGTRTKEVGKYVYLALTEGATFAEVLNDQNATGTLTKLPTGKAKEIARTIGGVFGVMQKDDGKKSKGKKANDKDEAKQESLFSVAADATGIPEDGGDGKQDWRPFKSEQLAHLSPAELEGVNALVEQYRKSGKVPEGEALNLLRKDAAAVDIALFGRMLAANPDCNVEAAAQVAHAMTVHTVTVEDDFFTAVDDLNRTDTGAGHMGVIEFGAGLFYLYLCINRDLLVDNLDGNEELAGQALSALTQAVCTVSPTGKQNSFASRAVASFCLAEKGDAQPRTLAEAFMPALKSDDVLTEAIKKLEEKRNSFNRIMGEDPQHLSYSHDKGSLADVAAFVAAR